MAPLGAILVVNSAGLPDFVFNNKMHVFLEIKSFFNIKYNAEAGKTNNPGLGGHVTAYKVAASGEGYTQRHIFQRTTTPPYLILFYSGLCRMGRKVNLNIQKQYYLYPVHLKYKVILRS